MAKTKEGRAWLAVWTDPGMETQYTVWLDHDVALQNVAEGIVGKAKSDLENIEWTDDEEETLKDILKAFDKKDYEEVLALWDTWRGDMGPLQEDVELIEIDLVK